MLLGNEGSRKYSHSATGLTGSTLTGIHMKFRTGMSIAEFTLCIYSTASEELNSQKEISTRKFEARLDATIMVDLSFDLNTELTQVHHTVRH